MEILFPAYPELEPVAEKRSPQSPRTSRQLLMEMLSQLMYVLTSVKIAFVQGCVND